MKNANGAAVRRNKDATSDKLGHLALLTRPLSTANLPSLSEG